MKAAWRNMRQGSPGPSPDPARRRGACSLRQQLDEGWAGYQQMADGLAGYDAGIAQLEENIQKIKDLLAVMGENPGGEAGGETGENQDGEGQVTPPYALSSEVDADTDADRAGRTQATADITKTQLEEGEAGYQRDFRK